MSSKYDFGGSGSSGNNNDDSDDRGYAETFKIAPFTKMVGELSSVFIANSDWGQSIGVVYENAKIEDGILTKRTDKDQYKLFSWNDAPVIEDEDLTVDDLPPVLNKSYAGTSYKYEIIAARLEGDDEIGYGDDSTEASDDPIPLQAVIGDDRFTVFEGSSEYGPNSCAKTTAKMLTEAANGAVIDPDSQDNWAASDLSLRGDLQGVEVVYAKIQKQSDSSEHSFNHPVFEIVETGDTVFQYGSRENGGSSGESEEVEPTTDDGSESDPEDPVQEFYDTCGELSIDTEPAVLGLLEDMINDDDNDLTDSMVDREEIVADLTA